MQGGSGGAPRPQDALARAFSEAAPKPFEYKRRADAPATLRGEAMPPVSEDFEAGVAAHVDFSPVVLADRQRNRVQVQRAETGLFDPSDAVTEASEDVWATMSVEAIAARSEQIRLRLGEANERELLQRLLERFERAIVESGAEPPDQEYLLQQLELVLARRPQLLRNAYKSLRHQSIRDIDVPVPASIESTQALPPATRNVYGVMPPGLNNDEMAIAQVLDASPLVKWWHRNPSRTGIGLYRWDDGDGYYPDFVVCMHSRQGSEIALLEVKGDFLAGKESEVDKASATHLQYGRVYMVGRKRGERDFNFLRDLGGKLQSAGSFSVEQMQFS